MIVNYTEHGWQIVTQRSHGLLAAQICAHWAKRRQPSRWIETLIAAAEHDDMYNEFERDDLLNDTGGPRNFTTTKFVKADAQRLVRMAETKSAYMALLVARHIHFVHKKDSLAKDFCRLLHKQEKSWLKTCGATTAEVDESYGLLEFCDAFSLLLCQGLIQPERRKIEISTGTHGEAYTMHATGPGKLIVDPWPFEVSSFEVSYEIRLVEQLVFKTSTEFRKAIETCEVKTQRLLIHN